MKIQKEIIVSGKRKTAVAKAIIKPGGGKILINNIPYENLNMLHIYAIREPVDIAKNILGNFNFDIVVNVKGGGHEGQIEAGRLAIAKGLVAITKSNKLKEAFFNYDKHLLVADTRRKETYKPGDSKARAKRQKSYR
ncbi:30S ribosomal protein S9 [Candidatus Pacearchaeota archaeon]|nr:30S ribosomal protein S9 [Candidatus Pacearchaeota archaeon]